MPLVIAVVLNETSAKTFILQKVSAMHSITIVVMANLTTTLPECALVCVMMMNADKIKRK